MTKQQYVRCSKSDVPATVRFDVPRRNQGQIIEVGYGGIGRSEHDEGAPYKRVLDRSTAGEHVYYKLI